MASGMWFAIVTPEQPVLKKVKHGISLTQAVLDTENAKEADGITRLMMSMDGQNLVIANLSLKHGLLQTSLSLDFEQGDLIKLSVPAGSLPVHVFGCARVEADDLLEEAAMRYQNMMEGEEDSDDDDDIDEEEEDEVQQMSKQKMPVGSKRKGTGNPLLDRTFPSDDESDHSYIPTEEDLKNESRHKDLNLLEGEEDLESEDDDEEEDDEQGDEEMEDEELEGEEESDDDEEDDEDEEEDLEEEEEVVVPEPSKKKMKLLNGHAEAVPEQQKKKKDTLKELKNKTPQKDGAKQAAANSTPVQKKDKKKADNKENEHKGTPKQDKKKQKGDKSPAAKANEGSASKTPKKMMAGGVMAEDIVVGKGPAVKSGGWVSVYYEGRLKSNNSLFDKTVSGPPFKFRVGRGEVIKGWDVGLTGMKVGGKRKLVIPPNMGYGKQGCGREIPPNSALVFDVTVIAVN